MIILITGLKINKIRERMLPLTRFKILAITILFIILLLGLDTNTRPSEYAKTSFNYGRDKRVELLLYGSKIGDFRRAPHVGDYEGLNLQIEYSRGPHHTDLRYYIETKDFGFLVPFLPYKNILIVPVILFCAVLLSPLRNRLMNFAVSSTVKLYALSLIIIGICGAIFTPHRMSREISDASFGAFILAPLYLLMWFTYIIAIIPGVFILLRKRWAIIVGILAQTALIFGFGYLLKTMIEPSDWKLPGYRITILDPFWYSFGYILIVLLVIWFFTRPTVRKQFR